MARESASIAAVKLPEWGVSGPFRLAYPATSLTPAVPHSTLNLTRAREAFLYSIRRRSLRFAALVGVDAGMTQTCLQQALAAFLPESRVLQPADWTARWWALLLEQSSHFPEQPPIVTPSEAEPWQQCWNQLTKPQRSAFLLRVWLLLPSDDTARALGTAVDHSERQLAQASLQLRLALGADAQATHWLKVLREAFEHLDLGLPAPAPVANGRDSAQHATAPRQWRRPATLAAGIGLVLVGLAVTLLLPRQEPLPKDLRVPEGATGLVRSNKGPSALPQDVIMLLDQDWPLWSSPDDAAMLRQLEFYAWLESDDAK